MIFSMTYKNVELREPVEVEAGKHTSKLAKLLKSYAPDLIKLHGVLEKLSRKEEYRLTLNLTLPTGSMHCSGKGSDVRASLKLAFTELETQLKKHKEHLRHDYDWKRKRPRTAALA
jgi:ribosomal subunit interface protein